MFVSHNQLHPISGKRYTSYLGYSSPLAIRKHTPVSWLSRKIFPRLCPKIPPFPRTRLRPPYAFEWGGGRIECQKGLASTRSPTRLGRVAETNYVISAFFPRETRKKCANHRFLGHYYESLRRPGETGSIVVTITRLIPVLMKISESFEIQVNILEILRNKQSQKIVTTYPKVGVSCYSTWGKLLHLIMIVLYRQFGPAKHDIWFTCVCGDI